MEPISIGTALALGAGWFGNKILGPSADELGDQLKAFVGNRTRRIVEAAETKADPNLAKPLAPAFFYNFSQKAAFSENSVEINEMWSSLLADASEGQSYRHSLFADILTRLGAEEAKYLEWFCAKGDLLDGEVPANNWIKMKIEHALENADSGITDREVFAAEVQERFYEVDFNWPVRFEHTRFNAHTSTIEPVSTGVTTVSNSDHEEFAVEVLRREDIIEAFEIAFQFKWGSARIEGFKLTKIGAQFFIACSKVERE